MTHKWDNPDNWVQELVEHVQKSKGLHVSSDYKGYTCPVSGKWIEGRAAHRENLKRTGCRILEKGEREQNERNRRESEERSVNQLAEKMVSRFYE